MKKFITLIISFLLIFSSVNAYTPTAKDEKIITNMILKIEKAGNFEKSKGSLLKTLKKLENRYSINKRALYVLKEISDRINALHKVVSVSDGDTIKVEQDGKIKTIRMIGLDTPEKFPTRTGYEECYGKEASIFAEHTLSGKLVIIEKDLSQGLTDKYNRELGHVFLSSGVNYQELAIREGYGFYYLYKDPSKYDVRLIEAEKIAKTASIGVWKYCEGKRKPLTNMAIETQTGTTAPTTNSLSGAIQEEVKPTEVKPTEAKQVSPTIETILVTPNSNSIFSCTETKTYCTQMNSCNEAKFYLNTCGITRLDKNQDGVPCESLCQ